MTENLLIIFLSFLCSYLFVRREECSPTHLSPVFSVRGGGDVGCLATRVRTPHTERTMAISCDCKESERGRKERVRDGGGAGEDSWDLQSLCRVSRRKRETLPCRARPQGAQRAAAQAAIKDTSLSPPPPPPLRFHLPAANRANHAALAKATYDRKVAYM
jgi:hypothetical protein